MLICHIFINKQQIMEVNVSFSLVMKSLLNSGKNDGMAWSRLNSFRFITGILIPFFLWYKEEVTEKLVPLIAL